MSRQTIALCGVLAVLLAACSPEPAGSPSGQMSSAVLYEGARLIPGDERAPIEESAFLVENGAIARIGKRGELSVPGDTARVDLTGKTVMPALVNLHGHVGYQKGLSYAADNYTRENLIDHLNRYAYAGVGTVVSLGTDAGDLAFQIRDEQESGLLGGARLRTAGRGLAEPNAGPGVAALRGAPYGVASEEEARRAVRELAARNVDFVKIWVDDRNGTVPKLRPELSRAIIDEAHKHDLRVIAHVFYLTDARDLVAAGIDGFAHLVRDAEMDDELVRAIAERKVFVMPNIGISERSTQAEPPAWLNDPLLREILSTDVIQRVTDSYARRSAEAVERARGSYVRMQRSLAKLNAAGAPIVLGRQQTSQTLSGSETLDGGDLIPAFRLAVAEIFAL
jgi:imidazolonepropionase-like amidohydrolase